MSSSAHSSVLAKHPALKPLWKETRQRTVRDYADQLETQTASRHSAAHPAFRTASRNIFGTDLAEDFAAMHWLQTAPHIGFTLSDRMLTIAWMSHLATPGDGPLFIGGCSGVPMSIYTKPGYVFGAEMPEINLVPARYQNILIAGASSEVVDTDRLPAGEIKTLLQELRHDALDVWMHQVLSRVLSDWLGRTVVFFSLNEWARQAIVALVEAQDEQLDHLLSTSIDRSLFLSARTSGKYSKFTTWHSDGGRLLGNTGEILTKKEMLEDITAGVLHPTSWLMYAIMARVAGLPVAGSYNFASYYPGYQTDWETIAGIPRDKGQCIVTTGTHPALKGKSSWDVWLNGPAAHQLDEHMSMHTLLETIL